MTERAPWDHYIDIRPGSRFSFVNQNGTVYTDTIDQVTYSSGGANWVPLTRWQRVIRRLTPSRWRRPWPVIFTPPTVSFRTERPFWHTN